MIATNAFKQAIVGTYSSSDTVIELASISSTITNSDYLPDPASGEYNLVIYDGLFGNPADARNAGSYEIVRVTGIDYVANEITVIRGQENTSAITIGAGAFQAIFSATVKTFEDIQTEIDSKEPADATILKKADVIDNLTSDDTDKLLSANQGKVLQDTKVAKSGDTMTGILALPQIRLSGHVLRFSSLRDSSTINQGISFNLSSLNGIRNHFTITVKTVFKDKFTNSSGGSSVVYFHMWQATSGNINTTNSGVDFTAGTPPAVSLVNLGSGNFAIRVINQVSSDFNSGSIGASVEILSSDANLVLSSITNV